MDQYAVITHLERDGEQHIKLSAPVEGLIKLTKIDNVITWFFSTYTDAEHAVNVFRSTGGIASAHLIQ